MKQNFFIKEFICISNHIYEKPYPKTTTGEKLLQNVVNEYNKTHQKQELLDKLFELARYDAGYVEIFLFSSWPLYF
jgi:hypothetical protein